MKFIIGLAISFAVGAGCRYFDIPAGSPAVIPGALLVLAMSAGYSWTNQLLNARIYAVDPPARRHRRGKREPRTWLRLSLEYSPKTPRALELGKGGHHDLDADISRLPRDELGLRPP